MNLSVMDHQGLIHKYARQSFRRLRAFNIPVDYEDCIQEGNLIAIRALPKFSTSANTAVSTYLGRCLQNGLNRWADYLIFNATHCSSDMREHEGEEFSIFDLKPSGQVGPDVAADLLRSESPREILR